MSKLLNQGGFGCVYYPGLTNKGKTSNDKKYVSKIQRSNFNSNNEILIGKLIQTIPNYQLYFLPVISHHSISLGSIDPKLLDECQVISTLDKNKYVLMDIPYIQSLPFFSFLTETNRIKKNIILDVIDTYSYLLNCINLLINKEIVHFDLKPDNIIYSKRSKIPYLLDFGISIPIAKINHDNIKNYFYIYAPEYYIWPLEVHVINYLTNETDKPLTKTDIDSISNIFVTHNKGLDIFSLEFRNNYKKMCISVLSDYVGINPKKVIDKLLTYYKTWDNYSLSIVYLRIFHLMFGKGYVKNKLLIYFSQLLLENISPQAIKRNSINETRIKYKNIFNIDESNDNFIDIINQFDYDYNYITKQISEDLNSLRKIRNK